MGPEESHDRLGCARPKTASGRARAPRNYPPCFGFWASFSRPRVPTTRGLQSSVFGLRFPNPIGLAAGFDKDAEVPDAMLKFGFGFVECGTLTPRPQAGNPKPRLFRLREDRAVINRMGFNNGGMEAAAQRLGAPQAPRHRRHQYRRQQGFCGSHRRLCVGRSNASRRLRTT